MNNALVKAHDARSLAYRCARARPRSRPRHDRLMQTYDVMRLDINIFPPIRQTAGPTSARLLNGKTITLVVACARAGRRGNLPPCPVHHAVPTATGRRTERSCRVLEVDKPRRSRYPDASRPASRRARASVLCRSDNRSAAGRIKARRLRKDTQMRARYLTATRAKRHVDNTPGVCAPPARTFASPRARGVHRAIHGTARRVVNLCGFAIPCLLPSGRTRSAIGNCKFCGGIGTSRCLCGTSILDGCNNNKSA